jgi:hypothetical protein
VLGRIASLLCPLMLAVFPLLSLFAHNQAEIELSVLWWPLVLCLIGTTAVFGILLLITRRAANAGVLTSLVVVGFFYYGLLSDQGRWWFLAVWLGVLVAVLVAVLRTKRDLFKVIVVLGVGAAAMTLPQVGHIVIYRSDHPSLSAADPRLWPTALAQPDVPAGTAMPDIYVLMPDDYVRADVLKKYFQYDDSAFVRELEKRGCTVSMEARSPYSYSEMNMASLLNLDYLSQFPTVLGKTSQDMRPVKRVLEDNRASRLLTSLGYDYVHIDTDEVTYAGRNPDISPVATPDSFMALWLQTSILRPMGGPLGFNDAAMDERFRDSIRSGFADLAALRPGDRPKFVVFHTLIPHDPFIFGAQGQPVTFPSGADHTGKVGMEYYVQQLQYVNQLLLDSLDQILANATTPPVVVIQSDEGFEVDPAVVGEAAAQDMRVKGLSVFCLPGKSQVGVPSPPNTVNDLRFVFNHYLDTSYPMLESVSYPELDLLYEFDEIRVK